MRVTVTLADEDGTVLEQRRFPDGVTAGIIMSLLEAGAWHTNKLGTCDECGHFFRKDELVLFPDDTADGDWLCPTCMAERRMREAAEAIDRLVGN